MMVVKMSIEEEEEITDIELTKKLFKSNIKLYGQKQGHYK
jgi:hypothetical protein